MSNDENEREREGTVRAAPLVFSGFIGGILVLALLSGIEAQSQGARWYKGNTHTLNSDGDSTPDDVVKWYREHGYQFLVLTDHNFLTSVEGLNALHGANEKFLVVKGEEVTDTFKDASRDSSIHVNGLDVGQQ